MATHECMRPVLLGVLEAVRTRWDQRDVAETFPRGIRHSRTEQTSVDGFLTREDVGDVAVMQLHLGECQDAPLPDGLNLGD